MKKRHLSLLLAVVGSLTSITARADVVFVSNRSAAAIEQFTSGGVGSVFATNALTHPEGLAADVAGNVYASDDVQSKIYKFTPCGDGSVFFSNPNLLRTPEGLVVDSAGNLYAASFGNNTILKIAPDGTGSVFATDPGTHFLLSGPIGLAFDSADNLYVANAGNNRITRFTPSGVGSVFSTNNLSYPSGIAFDSAGNLYVANQTSYTISRFTPGGGSSVFANTNNGINWPTAVAFDSADNLYVVNYGNNKLLKFTPGGVGSTFASTNLSGPTFIAIQGAPMPSTPSLPGSASFTYNNFADTAGLQFNGNAAPANTCDGPILQLTASAASQAGSAFTANAIPLAANAAFSTFFTFRLSKPGGAVDSDGVQGGDGIAFVIQSAGSKAVGVASGGMGYVGMANSLIVEFDTFNNGTSLGNPGDPDGNHIAVNLNGTLNDSVSVPIPQALNNGNVWYAWIDYSGVSQRLEVRLSEIAVRPETSLLTTTVNLPSVLATTHAFVGFTAGTGSAWNEQDILSWKFAATPTLRMTGHFVLTNTPPGFTLTNGVLVRQFRYSVNGTRYTTHYLYPLSFAQNTDGTVSFSSQPESGLSPGLGANDGQEETAVLAEYRQTPPAYRKKILGPIGGIVILPPIIDPNVLGQALATTFDKLFPLVNESQLESELQTLGNLSNPVETGFPAAALITPQVLEATIPLIQDTLSVPLYNEPLKQSILDSLQQLELLNSPAPGVEEIPDYAFEAVTCSAATNVGILTATRQVTLAPPLPLHLLSPHTVGATNFAFSFLSISNQAYTVWANPNPTTTNWVRFTNFVADGFTRQLNIPIANSPQRFFRVSAP